MPFLARKLYPSPLPSTRCSPGQACPQPKHSNKAMECIKAPEPTDYEMNKGLRLIKRLAIHHGLPVGAQAYSAPSDRPASLRRTLMNACTIGLRPLCSHQPPLHHATQKLSKIALDQALPAGSHDCAVANEYRILTTKDVIKGEQCHLTMGLRADRQLTM